MESLEIHVFIVCFLYTEFLTFKLKFFIFMAIIKSFSFPEGEIRGDMFYIKHGSDNFTVIDCFLKNLDDRDVSIIKEICDESSEKSIHRFISTHPDADHYKGIETLWKYWSTTNFYVVENKLPIDNSDLSLKKYGELRDSNSTSYIYRGFKRAFLNEDGVSDNGNHIGCSGIHILWPIVNNTLFQEELVKVKNGESPNNISPAISYSINGSASFLWMGDMETDMQTEFYKECKGCIGHKDIVFAPHHGRESGSIPKELLEELSPKIIVVGNAPSKNLNYYDSSKTITQNTAGDIVFSTEEGKVHVFCENQIDNAPDCLTKQRFVPPTPTSAKGMIYIGTLTL